MKGSFFAFFLLLFLFTSCKTGSKSTIKNIVATQRNIMPADSIINKQKKGIDLYATGNDPAAWSLEIDFDKMVSFSSSDGTKLDVLPSFDKKEITAGSETYHIKTDAGTMTIQVFNAACTNPGSGEQYSKKAEVTINNKRYTGCGKYLFDHRLNDIWELESIDNIFQSASGYPKGLPRLEFNLQINKMNGSDGCNTISADIEVKGNRIKFYPFTGTRMVCNTKAEKIFYSMLSNNLVDYYLENNKLVLYLEDDSKLFFKRKSL